MHKVQPARQLVVVTVAVVIHLPNPCPATDCHHYAHRSTNSRYHHEPSHPAVRIVAELFHFFSYCAPIYSALCLQKTNEIN